MPAVRAGSERCEEPVREVNRHVLAGQALQQATRAVKLGQASSARLACAQVGGDHLPCQRRQVLVDAGVQ
jgi:hypothetical protein